MIYYSKGDKVFCKKKNEKATIREDYCMTDTVLMCPVCGQTPWNPEFESNHEKRGEK